MSLGEISLVAAYQGEGQWKVDHQERGWWQWWWWWRRRRPQRPRRRPRRPRRRWRLWWWWLWFAILSQCAF